ncbi:MAG: DEAD/DEAH box helicase [Halothiobacillaceae bacterium]|nr:DEAD/DEAH box helicase [Halothiobacillaceae bacterium]
MTSLKKISQAEMIRSFGRTTFDRGRAYLGNVVELHADDDRCQAFVQGSGREPYELGIQLRGGPGGRPQIQSWCSCPMGRHCKHVVAALLAAQQMTARREAPDASPLQAWEHTLRLLVQPPAEPVAKNKLQLYYRLEYDGVRGAWCVRLFKAGVGLERYVFDAGEEWHALDRALVKQPKFVCDEDMPLLRMLYFFARSATGGGGYPLVGQTGAQLMPILLATGRLVFREQLLHPGAPRTGSVQWHPDEQMRLVPRLAVGQGTELMLLQPPWFVDGSLHQAGRVECGLDDRVLERLLGIPPLARDEIKRAAGLLHELAPQVTPPSAAILDAIRSVGGKPRATLRFDTVQHPEYERLPYYLRAMQPAEYDVAQPKLHYEDVAVPLHQTGDVIRLADGEVVRLARNKAAESKLRQALDVLPHMRSRRSQGQAVPASEGYALDFMGGWDDFRDLVLPRLQKAGWQIEYAPGFRHREMEVEAWQADIEEDAGGWFDVDMGIVVEGRRLALAPLLADLFGHDERWLDGIRREHIADGEKISLQTDDGLVIRVEAARLKPIAATLLDLFSGRLQADTLRVHKLDAPRLAALTDLSRWQFRGDEAVKAMATRLREAGAVAAVAPPAGFRGDLREYQQQGLAWLQYLRVHGLAGILADDMGLGKTAQAIAHLLTEKEQGRMDRPSLIVLPTSLVFNWKRELARFAPGLSVLVLHGTDRKQQFEAIADHDLVLTTYPLLWRDAGELLPYDYHYLLLDEAQYVKNAGSKSAQALRQLRARHRLCLTGTPMENHLGELWAQFDFLMPGFLEDHKRFTRTWRTPIEKNGDTARLQLLNRRVRPFILRRRKEDVARELPPKTLIVRAVELEGAQRDLYETVRSAMDSKVRAEIAGRGLNRSQIVILDALLKLRQVCCDPHLLKGVKLGRKTASAKLELLCEMLPEMVAEGRRILLFSQFTEMLGLIETRLAELGIGYVKLTGQTRDRATPVEMFQSGEVPLFLISLKAGGVGLNLTAADTVIHYDPWWNPAAENQATDRAHRIGQQNSVFVYKLVVAGSIEEKILGLQEKKASLAGGALGRDEASALKFGAEEIAALFAPLPEA